MGETGRSLRELCEGLGMPEGQTAVVDWLAGYLGGVVELPVGADGRPIRPGEAVYGSDGKGWIVEYVRFGPVERARKYPIAVIGPNGEKRKLRAEWLTHERPDSREMVVSDIGKAMARRIDALVSSGRWGND